VVEPLSILTLKGLKGVERGTASMAEALRKFRDFILRQKSNFRVLLVRGVCSSFSKGLTQNYISIYVVELGADTIQLGGLNSVGSLVNTFISAPIGWLADRYSLKTAFLLGLILEVLMPLFFALAWSWEMLVIPIVLSSMTMVTTLTIERVLAADSLKDRDRATGFGVLMTLSQIPVMVAPVVAGIIVERLGGISAEAIRPLFYISFVISLLASAWTYFKLKEVEPSPSIRHESFLSGFKRVLAGRWWLKRWLLVELLGSFIFGSTLPFITVYAVEVKGADAITLGLMGSALSLVSTIFSIPLGRLGDKIGRKKTILLLRPTLYLSYMLLVWAPRPEFLILSFALRGFLWSATNVWMSMQMELVPREERGRWGGTINTFRSIVRIPAPIIGGFLWTYVDPSVPFLLLILVDSLVRMPILSTVPETLTELEKDGGIRPSTRKPD